MFEKLTKKPFKDRLKDTVFLLKHSFTIIGKEKDIKKPIVHMISFSILVTSSIFIFILTLLLKKFIFFGVLFFLFWLFLTFYKYFFYVRRKADISWLVYNTLCGNDISYNDAHLHTKNEKSKLRYIAAIEILMKYFGRLRKKEKGIGAALVNLFLRAIAEAWDLLSNYMIPAVVIERKPLKEIIPNVKNLGKNVPAALVGVFGIDFAGNVIHLLIAPFYLACLIISVFLGYLISLFTQTTVIKFFPIHFSWVPPFIFIYIAIIIGWIIKLLVEAVKIIYFTIFYTSITRPNSIIPSIREEITNYLLMKKKS